MKTLITLLGNSPGVVTGVYYALYASNPADLPERVVVIATDTAESEQSLNLIREKFRGPKEDEPAGPRLEIVRVPIDDLKDQATTAHFQGEMARVLREQRDIPDNEVWLSIAGGRKSMAALAAIAAQLIGVHQIIHLYVDWELEQRGDINQLLVHPEWQAECLHPPQGRYTLVEVPAYDFGQTGEQLWRWAETGFGTFFVEVLRANPQLLGEVARHPELVQRYWQEAVAYYTPSVPHYETLTIQILAPQQPDAPFPVRLFGEGLPDASGHFTPFFQPAEIGTFVELIARPHLLDNDRQTLRALGEKLFQGLFAGSLGRVFYQVQGKLDASRSGLRICFDIDPQAKLGDLPLARVPWELLAEEDLPDSSAFLALRPNLSLSRYLPVAQPAGLRPEPLPLRVQVAAAMPKDLTPLPETYERETLYTKLGIAFPAMVINDSAAPLRTFEALRHAVESWHPHVVYFTGHGGPGILCFEDDQGNLDVRPAEVVGNMLAGNDVKLVVLNACYGAQGQAAELISVAEGLMHAGIPAVVAMQSPILTGQVSYAPAVVFSREFFYQLMLGLPIDICVATARRAMYQSLPGSYQWVTPVCFLRSADGNLFTWEQS